MSIYYVNSLSLLLYGYILKANKIQSKNKLFITLSFIHLQFIYTLRSLEVGWDSKIYVSIFESNIHITDIFDHYMEKGYLILNIIVRFFSNNYIYLWFAIGILIFIPILNIFYKYSNDINLSVFIFTMMGFYFNSMNQIRSFIALSICMLSFEKIYKKQYMNAILFILIAFTFHNSALIFILLIITYKFYMILKKRTYIILFSIAFLIFILFDHMVRILSKYIYSSYFNDEHLKIHLKGGNLKLCLVFICIFALGLLLRKYQLKYRKDIIIYDLCLLALFITILLEFLSVKLVMLTRFSNYFSIYSCILIPNALYRYKNTKMRFIIKIVVCIAIFLFSIYYLRISENGLGRDGVIPYQLYISTLNE